MQITVKHIILLTAVSIYILVLIRLRHYSEEKMLTLTPVSDSALTSSCDRILAKDLIPVKRSEFKIQLNAAMPGSGSAWSKAAIKLVTGYNVGQAHLYRKTSLHNISIATKYRPIYYKTHYPYISSVGEVDTYLHRHPEKVAVVIRNPFDAGFSEYVRGRVKSRRDHHQGKENMKYEGIEHKINESDFLADREASTSKSSRAFSTYYRSYLEKYQRFHKYWLLDYSGDLKVVFYMDLQKDEGLFIDIAEYLGYNYTSRPSRKKRITCFIQNIQSTQAIKRPRIPVVENSKQVLRDIFNKETEKTLEVTHGYFRKRYPKRKFNA